jgi:hypothetical protein
VNLALAHFQPLNISRNGFALKEYWPFPQFKDMFAASLSLGGDCQNEFGKAVGMVPDQKKLDFMFLSGSKELHIVIQPVTFEKMLLSKQNAGAQTGKGASNRIDRRNEFADRVNKIFTVPHALILELDLVEYNPPKDVSLDKHFADLMQKSDSVKKMLTLR